MDTVSFVRNELRKFKTFSYWLLHMYVAFSGFIIFACYLGYDMIGTTGLTTSVHVHKYICLTAKITPHLLRP